MSHVPFEKVAVLGAGKMGETLIRGLLSQGELEASEITASARKTRSSTSRRPRRRPRTACRRPPTKATPSRAVRTRTS